jgi:phosphoribosyl-ATP pyrophosphohydrolase
MGKSISYHAYLIESLKNKEVAEGYIEAALEESDANLLRKVIEEVIEAIGDCPDFETLQKAKQVLNASSGIY